jgi:hypothetical protein
MPDAKSIGNARNARENQGYRHRFLASIRDRLGRAVVKAKALDLCQELFLANGARSDEEQAVLQNLGSCLDRRGSIPDSRVAFGALDLVGC